MEAISKEPLEHSQIVKVVSTALKRIDSRLVDHGERVAYIAATLYEKGALTDQLDLKNLLFLSFFHDIGAYKTEEIDKMMEFENSNVWNHSIYGYLFLKNITFLGDSAEAILHHHTPYPALNPDSAWSPYAALIFFSDRVDLGIQNDTLNQLLTQYADDFSPELCAAFKTVNQNNALLAPLQDGSYKTKLYALLNKLGCSHEQLLEYLRLLVFSIDFRSPDTVTHTINTTIISQQLGRLMGFSEARLEELSFGAFLHDIGKIGIPFEILENPGRLSDEQMEIMKTHAKITEEILQLTVPVPVCRIAARHHEKLDGSGYPHGLTAADLTLAERIVAVADIMSALTCRRSYKKGFSKEQTLEILLSMRDNGKICPTVCEVVAQHYDDIMQLVTIMQKPIIDMYQHLAKEYERLCAVFSVAPSRCFC